MPNCQELYDRAKQNPNAVVMDVGEADPFIIHEAHAVVTFKDGIEGNRIIYTTFEYVKKHLKELKACDCDACQGAVAAYRVNKKLVSAFRRGATPKEALELVPSIWTRVLEN
jgi:hypothetical protein